MPAKNKKKRRIHVTSIRTSEVLDVKTAILNLDLASISRLNL